MKIFLKSFIVIAILGVVNIVGAKPASACTCMTNDFQKLYETSSTVLTGKIVSSNSDETDAAVWRMNVDVSEIFKSDGEIVSTIEVTSVGESTACGWLGKAGEEYVLFLTPQGNNVYRTNSCVGNQKLSAIVKEDLKNFSNDESSPPVSGPTDTDDPVDFNEFEFEVEEDTGYDSSILGVILVGVIVVVVAAYASILFYRNRKQRKFLKG